MNKIFFLLVSLTVLSAFAKEFPEHKVNINLSDSRIQWTGVKPDDEKSGIAKFTEGELVLDNTEIKGESH